jgi:hypothetical protein
MYHPDRAFDDGFDAQVLGTDAFVVCAICGLNVPDSMRDQGYKERWHRAMRRHLRQERYRMLLSLALLIQMEPNAYINGLFDFVVRRLEAHYPEKTLPELIDAGDKLLRLLASQT